MTILNIRNADGTTGATDLDTSTEPARSLGTSTEPVDRAITPTDKDAVIRSIALRERGITTT